MAEDSVQNDADTFLLSLFSEFDKFSLCTERSVDLHVVPCVIPVI